MIAELQEINIEKLREIINSNAHVLEALWSELMPGILLLLFNQKKLEIPIFLADSHWKKVALLLEKKSVIKVLKVGDKGLSLPAGGFLLQGVLKQKIKRDKATLTKKEEAEMLAKK